MRSAGIGTRSTMSMPERTIASYFRLLIDTRRSMRLMPSQCSTSGISSWKRTSCTPATHSVRSKYAAARSPPGCRLRAL